MDAYFAYSPFQLFNVLNMKMNENGNCKGDLYIVDIFNGAKELSISIRDAKLYENVVLIDKDTMDKSYFAFFTTKKLKTTKIRYRIYHLFSNSIFLNDFFYRKTPLYKKIF